MCVCVVQRCLSVCVVGQCAVLQRAIGMQSNIHTNSNNYFSRTHTEAKLHVSH